MINARLWKMLTLIWVSPRCKAVLFLVIAAAFIPAPVSGSWREVDAIMQEAYGAQAVRECQDHYKGLDLADDQAAVVREGIAILVQAGYPSGCPKEYLKLVAQLSRAGIHLNDLTNKIREGVAKNVSPVRLTAVITRRAEALLEARVLTLKLAGEKVEFLDRQMTYTVIGDYLLRGVKPEELMAGVLNGDLGQYPALERLIR